MQTGTTNQAADCQTAPSGGVVRLGDDVTLADMRVVPSADGQCLLVYCRERIVALLCSMGSDVEAFEFGNSERICAMELLDRVAVDAG
jgi:hypothetical protein